MTLFNNFMYGQNHIPHHKETYQPKQAMHSTCLHLS